jgi:hypothetical protein
MRKAKRVKGKGTGSANGEVVARRKGIVTELPRRFGLGG